MMAVVVVVQVNHLSEGLMAAGSKGTSWAQLQVETAANHGWDSRLSCYLAAGVNIQVGREVTN